MWLWRFTSYVTMDSQDVFLFLAVDQLAVETLAVFFFDINVFGHGLRLMLKGHAALETS